MSITIPLTKGYETVVDDEDSDLADLKWNTTIGLTTQYATRTDYSGAKKVGLYLHRVILVRILQRPLLRAEYVDHWDCNGLNNTRKNLRFYHAGDHR